MKNLVQWLDEMQLENLHITVRASYIQSWMAVKTWKHVNHITCNIKYDTVPTSMMSIFTCQALDCIIHLFTDPGLWWFFLISKTKRPVTGKQLKIQFGRHCPLSFPSCSKHTPPIGFFYEGQEKEGPRHTGKRETLRVLGFFLRKLKEWILHSPRGLGRKAANGE